MPRLQFITFREPDLGGGIDQQAAENQILPGYCEDLANADPKSTGQIAKRTGYQGYAGYVPVRVKSVEYSGTDIELTLDSSIELPVKQSSPLIIFGQTSVASGDFASETALYFDNFTADNREDFAVGSGTISKTSDDHSLTSPRMFVGTATSDSLTDNSNFHITPDSIEITKATAAVDVDYTNSTGSSFEGFIYFKDKTAVTGETFVSSGNTVTTGSYSLSIPSASHLLNNNNIIVKAFRDTGTEYVEFIPEAVKIDSLGDVTIEIENNTGATFTGEFILTAAPAANIATGTVASGASTSLAIDLSTVANSTDFAFVACYLEPTPGAELEQVIPDSVSIDSATQQLSISFSNNNATGANFEIYYEFAEISNNKITVTGTASATFSDTAPQLTVYGLCHEEIYGDDKAAREGWVNHIDSYRIPGETRLISGLGGNLFAARFRTEGVNADTYLMPAIYPSLNNRISTDLVIGPAFYDTGETPARTRGFITGDNGASNFFTISDISYVGGLVRYTLEVPNLAVTGLLSTIINTTDGVEDRFTAQQCGYAVHNGTFPVKSAAVAGDTLLIDVENAEITSDDFDEADVGGLGGIFTDRLELLTTSPFLPGDTIKSAVFTDSDIHTCINSSSTTLVIDNVVDTKTIPGGLRIAGARESEVIPARTLLNSPTVDNVVRGDMLTYTGISRELRVKSVNQLADTSISITGDGIDTATVTLGSGDTSSLFVGKKLLVTGTSSYNGTIEVTGITTSTAFTFASSLSTTEAGTLIGKTIQIDESLSFEDTIDNSNLFTVSARWIPVEAPTDSYDLTPSTTVSYFDSQTYENQNILRSTMVQDNLYLTNHSDEVMKFDGISLYRAGLFRWQPHLFVTTDTSPAGKINMDNPSISRSGFTENRYTVNSGDEISFRTGDLIQDSTDGAIYTVTDTSTAGTVIVDRSISGAAGAGTLTRTKTFLYYFRLNAVDANDNIVASAVTGSEDFAVRLGADAAVSIKLIGMPAWDVYDYDRLEVQIYRTAGDTPGPYFLLTTLAMEFDNDGGYLQYTDTDSDEDLRTFDVVNTALKGAELGTAWNQPIRAKYCTSSGNRLILGNLKEYPTLDIRVVKNTNVLTQSVFTDADNKLWMFKKDNTDTGTTTDMVNRAQYEFTSSSATVNGITGTAGASFSVDSTAHGLAAGDWVYLFHSAVTDGDKLTYSGWWQVNSITDPDNYVVLHSGAEAGAATAFPDQMATATAKEDIPVYIGEDGNYSMVNGNRSSIFPYEFLAMRRLANAINASMRKVDITVSSFEDFTPWMIGNAGNEFETGQLIIRQPKVLDTFLEVTVPSLSSDFSVFINNVKRSGDEQVSALTRVYPSRIIASYQNYPEIFDNPSAVLDTESDSVIDINSADGQEITAIIPFFGDAAFGSSQKSGIIVVFKTNSVYLVDLAAKDRGENAVQRLETRGKGCTAPFSVSVTRGGIMFANDTGIYRLGRDLRVEYVGRKYERKFIDTVNINQLSIATGHHDTVANSYKLCYPLTSATENSTVAVYNHTREYEQKGEGSWTTYTNHPATGWANLDAASFFASTAGRVFQIRRLGETSDYRDDDQAIAMEIITRAIDAGDSSRRKIFGKILTHYRTVGTSTGTRLESSIDLKTVFQETDEFNITSIEESSGVEDEGAQKILTISSVLGNKVGIFLQIKYTNNSKDEPVEIAGIDIRVAAKSSAGILEAAAT